MGLSTFHYVPLQHCGDNGKAADYSEWEYRRALTYQGTGSRVQAFLAKARSGRPFTVSVIGGSGMSTPLQRNPKLMSSVERSRSDTTSIRTLLTASTTYPGDERAI
jgi:hypothetical protein